MKLLLILHGLNSRSMLSLLIVFALWKAHSLKLVHLILLMMSL